MDYRQQEHFLAGSRGWGAGCVLLLLASAAACLAATSAVAGRQTVPFILSITALAVFLYYTPDYLHLTVNPEKCTRWVVRVRWRLIAAALITGMIVASGAQIRLLVLVTVLWLFSTNLLARRALPSRRIPAFLWLADFVLLAGLLLFLRLDLLVGAVLLAATAHLLIVTMKANLARWALLALSSGGILIFAAAGLRGMEGAAALGLSSPLLVTVLATAWLVHRARRQNARNVSASMD